MSDNLITAVVSIVLAIIGLASLSVVLSKNANTSGVLQSAAQGLSTDIGAAVAPIGGGGLGSLSMPTLSAGNGFQ